MVDFVNFRSRNTRIEYWMDVMAIFELINESNFIYFLFCEKVVQILADM